MNILKRHCLTALLLLTATLPALAQSGQYGNEWIDYSKTYYKFKVAQDGIYRISRASLDAAGLPATVTGSNFILYRDGREVPVWVSNENMSGTDYIEFIGRKPDGMLDKELYAVTNAVPANEYVSLFADTACYFLTYDNSTAHARYAATANNIPATTPSPEPWCWSTSAEYYKNTYLPGKTSYLGHAFYASVFDPGEGFVNGLSGIGSSMSLYLPTPNAVTSAPVSALLRTNVVTVSYSSTHEFKISVNNLQLADSSFGVSEAKPFSLPLPAGQIAATNEIRYTPIVHGADYDGYGISYVALDYPRNYDVSGLSYFPFRLNASTSPQYLEFLNLGAGQNRLYDATNRRWYTGNVSVSGKTRFYLLPSATDRDLVLYASAAPVAVSPVKTIHFTDFTAAANQGDYIIVTHSALSQPASGHNYIQDYTDYRNAPAGGQHKVVVANVDELYDAFAYGYDMHPQAIRHLLQYAYNNWSTKPVYVNLIGHGLTFKHYREYRASQSSYPYAIVPTYGDPGADVDFVNFGTDRKQMMQIGRLSIQTPQDIGIYLDKVKSYEIALQPALNPTATTEMWKKQVLHIVGTSDQQIQDILLSTMNEGKYIIEDTLTGSKVYTIQKETTSIINLINSQFVDSMINNGVSMITFHGHAGPTGFDYSLNDPEKYHGGPRLPLFLAMGCDVALIFELTTARTITERYILTPNGGAIAMVASDNAGFTSFYPIYLRAIYNSMAVKNYGGSIGRHYQAGYDSSINYIKNSFNYDFYFANLENQLLIGDPALHMYAAPKPDYHVNDNGLSAIPGNVTTTLDSFRLRITSYNLGKAIKDTVWVKIEHINPAGATTTVSTIPVINLYSIDTSFVWVPINKIKDLGLNKYRVTIDSRNDFDEVSETNNVANLDLFIYSDNLVPVYPKEFAIVNKQNVILKASTLNPFRPVGRYRLEMDTTMLFNSPQKLSTTITSAGGVIKWTPGMFLRDSVVYYWRTAFDSTVNASYQWTASSFIYLAQGSSGWNQSHYYQYTRDTYDSLNLDNDRAFRFPLQNNSLHGLNTVVQVDSDGDYMRTYWNEVAVNRLPSSHYNALQVVVIDSVSGQFWLNSAAYTAGSYPPQALNKGTYVHEFYTGSAAGRAAATHYIDSIPNGNYVMMKNILYGFQSGPEVYVDVWKTDNGRTLYDAIRDLGFSKIDSYNRVRVFLFMRRKGDASYPVYQEMTDTPGQRISTYFTVPSRGTSGQLNSTVIGPAKAWTSLKWKYHSTDIQSQLDSAVVAIYGIDTLKAETLLYTGTARDTALSFINARQYPNIHLKWIAFDTTAHTSPQADYLRVLYSPVPEAALNPAIHYAFSDSLQSGQMETFSVAVENLTELPMDSMLVRYKVVDANGVNHTLANVRYRPLPGNDTLHASYTFDPRPYPGKNAFFVEANPDNDQPEEYHPNNLGYLPLRISVDQRNPLLDVTFDGVHILDQDIVSSKPYIKIALKDENKYLSLDDTGLISVSLRYPSDPASVSRVIPFDGTTCRFIPAQASASGKNEAVVELRPDLAEDGGYTMFVTGKDRSGNLAGQSQGSTAKAQYEVEFVVENKPTVTNVLNYPNPFSTSTAFLFTITGSQIPSQFKIQILSVTGKVVREITKEELGPLHIGRNITEYKWDGRDQYGQMLGNGVYMYRVATSLNGNSIEHRESGADKYFKNGYGKMVIMR